MVIGDVGVAGMAGTARSRDPRTRILQAAARTLTSEGYDGARLRSIAKDAGVSIGLLQHYFETREGLLTEAVGWMTGELLAGWAAVDDAGRDAWQRLTTLLDSLTMRGDLRERSRAWTEFCASSARHPELRSAVHAVYAKWRALVLDIVEAGIAAGVFDPVLPATDVADVIVTQIDGCEMATAVDSGVLDGERFRHLVLSSAAVLLRLSPVEPADEAR